MNRNIIEHKPIETIATMVLMLLILDYIFNVSLFEYIAVSLLFIGLLSEMCAHWIAILWNCVIGLLRKIITIALLSAVYCIFVTPIALVYRLVHKDFIRVTPKEKVSECCWHHREHVYNKEDLANPW